MKKITRKRYKKILLSDENLPIGQTFTKFIKASRLNSEYVEITCWRAFHSTHHLFYRTSMKKIANKNFKK